MKINFVKEYKLELILDDGSTGIIGFQAYLAKGRIFRQLADESYFRQVMALLNRFGSSLAMWRRRGVGPLGLFEEG